LFYLNLIFGPFLSSLGSDSRDSRGVETVKARVTHLQSHKGLLLAMSRVYIDNLNARVSE